MLCSEIATPHPLNLQVHFSLNPLKSPVSKVAPNVDGADSANINQQAAKREGWYSTTSTGTQTMPTIDIELRWAPSNGTRGSRHRTKLLVLKEHNQISIAWEIDDVPFFLLLFLSLKTFPCFPAVSSFFAAAGGCVASRCWWIAANGSSWNCGLSSTALRWADSCNLDKKFGFRDSWRAWPPEARNKGGLH